MDITWGYGHCDLAVNRDLPCGSHEVVAFNPDIIADDTLTITDVEGLAVNLSGSDDTTITALKATEHGSVSAACSKGTLSGILWRQRAGTFTNLVIAPFTP